MKEQKVKLVFVSSYILVCLAIFLFLICGKAFAVIPASERAALIALYNSTDGDNWWNNDGWKTPPLAADGFALPGTEENWYGITYNSTNTAVQMIKLNENLLQGSIPPELGELTNLMYLFFINNNLSGSIPPELGSLTNLRILCLHFNNLSGSIPPELGNLYNLEELMLNDNSLSGSIPPELGNLTNVHYIHLDSNRLSGKIPAALQNLNLYPYSIAGSLYLCRNALYTKNAALRDFLGGWDDARCHWENTQTVAPAKVSASAISPYSVDIQWEPIIYKEDSGCYRVLYSTSAKGHFKFFGRTADKYASSMTVTGLKHGTTYYFKIQTRTDPTIRNRNTVDSQFSRVVSATTETIYFIISGTVTYQGSGLPMVTLTLSNNGGTVSTDLNGYYYVRVESGWSGTITPSKGYCRFTPAVRTYSPVYSEQTNQDFTAFIPITLHIGVERKTERAFIISRDYAVITLSLENTSNIPGIRCVLERKVNGGIFQPIKEFAGSELSGVAYVYTDKFLDQDKAYSYRLVAYDSQGNHLISSNEATITNLQLGLLEGGKKNERTKSKEK